MSKSSAMTTIVLNETTEKKDRLSIIDVLTNFAEQSFLYNQEALELLRQMKVSEKLIGMVLKTLEKDKIYFDQNINELFDVIKPDPQQRVRILDACAIAAYHKQTDYPIVPRLLSDDAPQFKLLTSAQGLCWVQSVRHYKKLKPVVPQFREKLEEFRGQYWDYYAELLSSPEKPNPR